MCVNCKNIASSFLKEIDVNPQIENERNGLLQYSVKIVLLYPTGTQKSAMAKALTSNHIYTVSDLLACSLSDLKNILTKYQLSHVVETIQAFGFYMPQINDTSNALDA